MKLICGILGMLLLTGLAVAQPKKTASEDVATALKGLEDKRVQLQLKGDVAGLGALLADGFLSVTNTGEIRTKAETLDRLKTGAAKFESGKVDDMRVVVYGNSVVVIGHWAGKVVEKGKAFDESERFTDTWVKQNGQWRCVASQGTPIKK